MEVCRAGMLVAVCCAAAFAQDMPFQVQLKTPLSTSVSQKGDAVSAVVLSPDAFKGDLVTGKVTESKSGNKLHGEAILNFSFETLEHGGAAVPIASSITSISNSKGQADVDEEGRVIRKSSNVGKAVGGTALGGLLGGLTHGATGAAIGAGVGATASLILIEVAAQGPRVDFAAGSTIGLSAKSRGGPELASLKPNAAPATAPAQPVAAGSPPAPAPSTAGTAPGASVQPQLAALKIDFVPGEKPIFYDDFSDMGDDEPPPHWMVRGAAVELRKGGNIRQLTGLGESQLLSPKLPIPKNFTLEAEVLWPDAVYFNFGGDDACRSSNLSIQLHADRGPNRVRMEAHSSHGDLGYPELAADLTQPVSFALWVQDGRVRAYVDGSRMLDVNQVEIPENDRLCMQFYANPARPVGVRNLRLAESAPDFSTVMTTTGHYVTHGIYFDTDSARLKPESAAVMKAVAQGLDKNPNLKLEIDGYTDSTGDAQHNLELSKARAEAVRSVLVQQFSVQPGRLTSNGFGVDKPIASNDTPDGRAQNRRVEFTKQ